MAALESVDRTPEAGSFQTFPRHDDGPGGGVVCVGARRNPSGRGSGSL